jgi:DNA invertase Pin-like site-specific DNA recombinase
LGDGWADTSTPHGKLMITVLGGLAEFERHLILSRTNEGRVRAKARGVKFGRKPKLTKHQQVEALARIAHGETLTAIARSYNVWPAPGSEDTELGVFMGPEVSHGETKVYAGVQA